MKLKNRLLAAAFALALAGLSGQSALPTAVSLLIPEAAAADVADNQSLPLPAGMVRYELPNGLTVMLQPRKDPTNSLEARLAVRAGSVHEAENERGLAHFVEHMAFNGTRDFPGQTIFKRLEKLGIMLGADVNAVTSLGSTVYKLSIPRYSDEALDAALHTMSQWAFHLTFDEAAFNREREIIVEEWRLRQGIGSRINNPLQSLRYRGSLSEFRDPIGLIDVVRTAPVARARAFYERWYEPQNMTLYLAGDFDVKETKALIEKYFASEPRGTHTTPVDWGRFEAVKGKTVERIFDSEQSDRFVQVMMQETLEAPSDTVNTQWRDTLERLTLDILDTRFALMKENDAGNLQIADSSWILSPSQTQVLMIARPKTKETYEKALEDAGRELARLIAFGPTAEELSRAKAKRLGVLQGQAVNRARYPNATLADQTADAVIYRLPVIDKLTEYEMVKTFLEAVTPEHIRAAAQMLRDSNVKLAAVGPDDKAARQVTEKSLRAAWEKGANAKDVTPFDWVSKPVAVKLERPSVKAYTEKTELKSPTGHGEMYRYTLANGMRVFLLSDKGLSGNTSFNLRVAGGTSAVEPSGMTRVPAALTLPMRCGIGDLKAVDIRRAAQQAKTSIISYAELLHHGIRAETSLESLPTMLSLLHDRLASPVFCDEALGEIKTKSANQFRHSPAERKFMDAISLDAFVNGDELVSGEDDIVALGNAGDMQALEARLLGDPAKMTLYIATREKAEKVIKEVGPWMGSLKKRGDAVTGWVDEGVRPAANTGVKTFDWATAPKTMVQMHYRAPARWSQETADEVTAIGLVTNLALREKLRTEMSGVYVVSMNQLLAKEPAPYFLGRLNFTSAPERADQLIEKAKEAIRALAREGLTVQNFRQAKAMWRVNEERSRKETYWWADALAQTAGDQGEMAVLADIDRRIADLELGKTNALLKTLLSGEPMIYKLVPKQTDR